MKTEQYYIILWEDVGQELGSRGYPEGVLTNGVMVPVHTRREAESITDNCCQKRWVEWIEPASCCIRQVLTRKATLNYYQSLLSNPAMARSDRGSVSGGSQSPRVNR